MPYERSREEVEEALCSHLRLLERSAIAWDEGDDDEAGRMAIQLRIIVSDEMRRGTSLLRQLDLKGNLAFLNTCVEVEVEGGWLGSPGLTMMVVGGQRTYVPPLDGWRDSRERTHERLPFDAWWGQTVIRDSNDNRFSRRELVHFLADQDGGAHQDPGLDERYAALARLNAMGWTLIGGGREGPAESPVPSSVRQIAYELRETMREHAPEYLA